MREKQDLNCQKMTKILLILGFAFVGIVNCAKAQTYNENDKEGLRIFLRQLSSVAGKINAEQLGLTISDTVNWQTDEAWVSKIQGLTWDNSNPKRLIKIGCTPETDAEFCTRMATLGKVCGVITDYDNCGVLRTVDCGTDACTGTTSYCNQSTNTCTTQQTVGSWNNENLAGTLDAMSQTVGSWNNENLAGTLDATKWTKLQTLSCSGNQLIALDISNNTELKSLDCSDNRLLLSDLFAVSEVLKNNGALNRQLGSQILPTQTAILNTALDYTAQSEFGGIYTIFTITKGGSAAPPIDYTIDAGKTITFHTLGNYTIKMTNAAIISDNPAEVIFDVTVGTTGIAETVLQNVKVYPNPTSDKFVVELYESASVKLYNVLGMEVLTQIAIGKTEININYLPKGIYNILIFSGGKVIGNSKIVKY